MSLFPSAFETGASSSRSGPIAVPGAGKRKRSSLGKSDDQLRATEANLAKLMEKVERGEVREKSGNEGIGHVQKKKKGKGSQPESQPVQKQKGKGKVDVQNDKGKKNKDMPKSTPGKKPPKDTKDPKPSPKSQPKPQTKGKNKPAPVELPAPVTQPVESDEPMTDMQRQMRTKLEGARFRWINEQLYSTPSTEAVAMMKKDPKIFADVGIP